MALVKCVECGNEVSDKATACPKCGAPPSPPASTASPAGAVQSGTVPASSAPKRRSPFVTVGRFFLWAFILGGAWLIYRLALPGRSVEALVRGPQTIVDERVQLHEGDARGYGFSLPSARKVDVQVSANPKDINVWLMTESQWGTYQKVHGNLTGGRFEYMQGLSRAKILSWSGTDVLPQGSWRIVVERPREAVLFGDATNANVKIVGY